MRIAVQARGQQRVVCATCKGGLDDARWRCDACLTALHLECRAALRGCPTLGCRGGPWIARPPATRPARGWTWRHLAAALAAIWLAVGLLIGSSGPSHGRRHGSDWARGWEAPGERVAPPPPVEAPVPVGLDLGGSVNLGERWVYDVRTAAGLEMERLCTVIAVSPGSVRYRTQVRMRLPGASQLTPVGEATETDWVAGGGDWGRGEVQAVGLAGRTWRCLVSEANGARTWIPLDADGRPTFPPALRVEAEDYRLELREVLPPP